ncbi:EthD domain-containing protein [Aphanizomenon flos-aquae NRERC-008]|uniref:EthD domain-containing protein n=2 Tax=Aphanizomenon TaxID=1175 RepID=A0ABR8IWL8_APHFL|nr:EthD domain-containing protein [Aphanizomenon flos-aquae]MBD2391628.1 EthD domain-containing protein [Aphanizomenon flos-aquae FACHB-1171]MBD2558077.1 EthD domain-containing protein [Aphanizomenon flos-aquae FACHB-1290]MBD2656287.1 EthD domain-containing protein [Aphanizomenon flos-aquae FACHB-1265]MBD2672726.1 EthD domain-containing protein [Aphanizomenon flos-aquae FACHB-1416]MBD2686493.1 EthD domain-containing protein [Aphanizomenon flos-aquae FACHB-1249]
MLAVINKADKTDYSARDQQGKVAFYVLLWKRQGISLELFDNYWKDVHGPVCARLPGQYQYWQFHIAHNQGGFCPNIPGLDYTTDSEDNFDGIAELTFASEAERQTWFTASAILMDDEHNLFRKAIGYNSSPGNSITYVDKIPNGIPNGEIDAIKFHVMVKKAHGVSTEVFRRYLTETFARKVSSSNSVLKFRLHLFEAVDNSRPDAAGVSHYEPEEKQYHAAYEIAFANHLEREKFFASSEYLAAVKDAAKYIKQIQPFPERTAYTFVYDGQMTLAGQRSSSVAELITEIGALNQIQKDIESLMVNQTLYSQQTNGSQSGQNQPKATKKRTNYYTDLSADYSRPGLVTPYVAKKLIEDAERIVAMKEPKLPEISPYYTLAQIEQENRDWWPTHCEALRQGRGDILTGEYRDDLVYFCQDGPYQGLEQQKEREKHWWALIAQPGVTMCWPIVMFFGEHTYFEWKCVDDETNETLAKGNVTWVRRGHRGACYLKTEQLTFYRDVFAAQELLNLITTA